MSVLLVHSIYFIDNCIGFMSFLELWCQCKKWTGSVLASLSQVGTWPVCVHLWRLRSLHHWWRDWDVRGGNACTWRGHVELVLKACIALPLIIFYDIGLYCGERFGLIGTHFLSYNGDFFNCLLLWRVCSFLYIICHVGKYLVELLNCDHLGDAVLENGLDPFA